MNKNFEEIITLIINAGELIENYQKKFTITNKDDNTPVTEADIETSNYLKNNILKLFPNDVVFTEEDYTKLNFNKRTWLIDPLDGTKFFIEGKDTYSIILSCIENGVPVFGVIYYPKKKLYYYAQKGLGTYFVDKNGNTIKINLNENKGKISSVYKPSALKYEETLKLIEKMKKFGEVNELRPSGYICTEILSNNYDILILGGGKIFELGAMDILFNETGGFFGDLNGNRLKYKNDIIRFNFGCIGTINKGLLNSPSLFNK
ncbi:MAG: hypothetical protein PHN31_03895 [Candidatus Gracilibacteria bacterium]|nr:hypothetical protein [Candidatus Gracilibacteria bacterium]